MHGFYKFCSEHDYIYKVRKCDVQIIKALQNLGEKFATVILSTLNHRRIL